MGHEIVIAAIPMGIHYILVAPDIFPCEEITFDTVLMTNRFESDPLWRLEVLVQCHDS